MGAALCGSLLELILGFFIKPLRMLFPPVVISIGLSVGVKYFGGGAAVIIFEMILVSGVQSLLKGNLNDRNGLIVALALGLGVGIGQVPEVLCAASGLGHFDLWLERHHYDLCAEPDPAEAVGRQRWGERKINNILSRMEAERFAKTLRLSTVFGRMAKSAKKSEIQTEFCLDGLILQNGARGIDIRAKNGV